MQYARFMICLAVGMAGLCLVLKTLLDTLFAEWDFAEELKIILERPSLLDRSLLRLEDEIVDVDAPKLATRIDLGSRARERRQSLPVS